MNIDTAIAAFADDFVAQDEAVLAARDVADELGIDPLSPATCAALTVLTASAKARNVVEIGTGVGVSGIHLLRGMDPAGVLTSIDVEPEHHKYARSVFASAGFAPERTRLITGRALEVLPRLTDAGYDLVLIDGRRQEFPHYVEQALRLVKAGGLVIVSHALARGKVTDPAQRDPETTAVREALRALRLADDLHLTLLTVGDGLAVAVRT